MKASALFIIVSLLLSMVYAPSSFYVNADLTDNDEDHDDVFGLRSAPKKEKNACWKDAVGRGVGTKPDKRECPVGKELSLGLCYPKCKGEYTGVGPVCWEVCPTKYPTNGLVFCCVDEETCETYLKDLGIALPTALAKAIEDAVNGRFGMSLSLH